MRDASSGASPATNVDAVVIGAGFSGLYVLRGGAVEPAAQTGAADAPVAPAVAGVVSRRALFGRLATAGRVTKVAAPAGSGKTVLLRSWIAEAGLPQQVAWVPESRAAG